MINGAHVVIHSKNADAEMARLAAANVVCDAVTTAGWGRITEIVLPGDERIALYQPRHARP